MHVFEYAPNRTRECNVIKINYVRKARKSHLAGYFCNMGANKKPVFDFYILKRLFVYVKPYKKYLILAFIFTLGLAVVSPFRPSIIGDMVDEYIVKDQDSGALWWWTKIVIGMLIIEALFQFLTTYYANRSEERRVGKECRSRCLPYHYKKK